MTRKAMIYGVAGLVLLAGLGFAVSGRLSYGAGASAIIVNGVPLPPQTVQQLQQLYPVPIAPGRYWYDAFSGAYGIEGGPIVGQMISGLSLGGPLQANASRGTSGVFVNGRQLTFGEKGYIEQVCATPVIAGRYWVNAQGIGGYEGGPPAFNLGLCGRSQGGGGSSTKTYCDDAGNCTSSGILGTITTTP